MFGVSNDVFCFLPATVNHAAHAHIPLPAPGIHILKQDEEESQLPLTPSSSPRDNALVAAGNPPWKRDSATGMRARSPGVVGADDPGEALLSASPGRTRENTAAAEAGGGKRVSDVEALSKAGTAGDNGGRELSFFGFARQLATHGNFWL